MKSFKEYLIEQEFTLSKNVKQNDLGAIDNIVTCLLTSLEKLKHRPQAFNIAKRPENIKTIRHVLNDPEASRSSDKTKHDIIDFILTLSLKTSFKKSEPANDATGWVYIFKVNNCIEKFTVKGYNRKQNKIHQGINLYLKFKFQTYKDESDSIVVDDDSVSLEMISFHPT